MISEGRFWKDYRPLPAPNGEPMWEHKDTLAYPLERVWTVVETPGAGRRWYAMPGYHVVNRIGYVVTENPWTKGTEDAVWG